jgi:hypothetical protein
MTSPLTPAECVEVAELLARHSQEIEFFADHFDRWTGLENAKLPASVKNACQRELTRLRKLSNRVAEQTITEKP